MGLFFAQHKGKYHYYETAPDRVRYQRQDGQVSLTIKGRVSEVAVTLSVGDLT